jgi:RHS repeat-associated protein
VAAGLTGDVAESFTYTATGKRATMTDASGTTTYSYDDHDRLIAKATPQGTLSYTYDSVGNVASMNSSNTNGISVAYTYDNLNRLASVVDNRLPAGQNTTTYAYDPASNLATVTYPNGLSSTFTYDDLNRLKALNNYQYQLGPTGNRTSATEPSGRTVNWSYDGIYRLTNETISLDPHSNNGTVTYGLDPVGNRQTQTSSIPGIPTASFSYDADDRILSTETYDNNGNTLASGARTFTYDFANRLKSMNNGAVTLVYDGDGNRVTKTVGGVTTRYLVDNLNPTGYAQVAEEVGTGGVQRTYTYGVQRISQNRIVNGAGTPSFYGYDGGGSVRTLTDPTGTVTDTYDYDAWGNAVDTTGTTANVYVYRGEQYDPDLRLYYLRARYLNSVTGRFLTRDSYAGSIANPMALHRYLYAYGDPVDGSDPSGMNPVVAAATEVAAERLATSVIAISYGSQAGSPRRRPGRVLSEYTLITLAIATPFAVALMPTGAVNVSAQDIDCIWQVAGSFLAIGLVSAEGAIPAAVVRGAECEEDCVEGPWPDRLCHVTPCSNLNNAGGIRDTGLFPSQDGWTYLVPCGMTSGPDAKNSLSLRRLPGCVVEVDTKCLPNFKKCAGSPVKPANGGSGGGTEYKFGGPIPKECLHGGGVLPADHAF